MSHLSDEQLEDLLQRGGGGADDAHVRQCPQCRSRLDEARRMRDDLAAACEPFHLSAAGQERIRGALGLDAPARSVAGAAKEAVAAAPAGPQASKSTHVIRLARWLWPMVASAAAGILIGVGLLVYFISARPAEAAPAILARIHQQNLAGHGAFYSDADPHKLAEYFRTRLGFVPAMPKLGKGMRMRGCCIAHFRSRPVGTYVVDTPRGVISIIVVKDTPAAMGMHPIVHRHGRTIYLTYFAKCRMAAERLGNYTYCAVGIVSPHLLVDVLGQLI